MRQWRSMRKIVHFRDEYNGFNLVNLPYILKGSCLGAGTVNLEEEIK